MFVHFCMHTFWVNFHGAGEFAPARGALSGQRQRELGSLQYKLQAVVHHLGIKPASGHYVADVCDASDGKWRHFDDASVREVRRALCLRFCSRFVRSCHLDAAIRSSSMNVFLVCWSSV